MRIELTATGHVTADDVQDAMAEAWSEAVEQGDVSSITSLDADSTEASPYTAKPGGEGFGAVELILIAAAGRLISSIPERMLVRLFDEAIWPRLQARFGSSLKRPGGTE